MKRKSSFSIITPNFNMARFLPETIESVLANLQRGDEYFIIDGGSTDGSVDIIRQYESHLIGWISEPDQGYADALAKGFRLCHGELLGWINSGDLLLTGALQAAHDAIITGNYDLIFGDDVFFDEHGNVILHSSGYVHSLKWMMLYGGWTPLQDACFWRHSLYNLVGGINSELKYAADYDFFLRASLIGRCTYVPKIFSAFRQHKGQKSVTEAQQYEHERSICRQRALKQIRIPAPLRVAAEAYYYLQVRWRHHIARRFHRQAIQPGTPVATLLTR